MYLVCRFLGNGQLRIQINIAARWNECGSESKRGLRHELLSLTWTLESWVPIQLQGIIDCIVYVYSVFVVFCV
jgi:hypothetical protein